MVIKDPQGISMNLITYVDGERRKEQRESLVMTIDRYDYRCIETTVPTAATAVGGLAVDRRKPRRAPAFGTVCHRAIMVVGRNLAPRRASGFAR